MSFCYNFKKYSIFRSEKNQKLRAYEIVTSPQKFKILKPNKIRIIVHAIDRGESRLREVSWLSEVTSDKFC